MVERGPSPWESNRGRTQELAAGGQTDAGNESLINRLERSLNPAFTKASDNKIDNGTQSKRDLASPPKETMEAYSTSIAELALRQLSKQVMSKQDGKWVAGHGVNLIGSEKWNPKSAEQKNWVDSIAKHNKAPIKLPEQVQVKTAASIGDPAYVNEQLGSKLENSGREDSLYFGASVGLAIKFNDAKGDKIFVKDNDGKLVTGNDGKAKEFDATLKNGNVYDLGPLGKVFELNRDGDLRTFAVPVANLHKMPGFQVEKIGQDMINQALASGTPVENDVKVRFPNYFKTVDTTLDGLIGMGTKPGKGVPDMFIAQAQLKVVHAGSPEGIVSYERQTYETRTRSLAPAGPKVHSLDSSFVLLQANAKGEVFMSAKIDVADMKTPPKMDQLKKDNNLK